MKQRKSTSLIESAVNTGTGYLIAVGTQIVVLPLFNISLSMHENLEIAAIFMGIGLVRGYVFRRLFEWLRVTGRLA